MTAKEYLEKNKDINRGYRNLDVWKEAVNLYSFVDELIIGLKNISYRVRAQIEDSIFSVSSNIAEGYCRRSIKENIQFINIALSSLGENYSQMFTIFNANKITKSNFEEYDNRHYSLENKLIHFNKSMIEKVKNREEWRNDYTIREIVSKYDSIENELHL